MGHRQPLDCVGLDISLYFHLFFLVRLLKLVFILSIHQKSREWTPPRLYEWSLSTSIYVHTNIKQTISPQISVGKTDRFNLFLLTLVPEIDWKCLMECPLFLINSASRSCMPWQQNHKVAPTHTSTHTQTQTHTYCTCLPPSKVNRGWIFNPVCLLICEQDISKVGRIWTKPGEWVGLRDVFIAWRKQEKRRNCLELQEQLFKSKTQAASNPSLHIGVMMSCHHPHSTWPYKYNAARHLVPLSPKQNMLLLSYNEITARWELT